MPLDQNVANVCKHWNFFRRVWV